MCQRTVGHTVAALTEFEGPTHVYGVRESWDLESTTMIVGTFTLQSFSLLLLVDSGSTHSYIVNNLAGELGIP